MTRMPATFDDRLRAGEGPSPSARRRFHDLFATPLDLEMPGAAPVQIGRRRS